MTTGAQTCCRCGLEITDAQVFYEGSVGPICSLCMPQPLLQPVFDQQTLLDRIFAQHAHICAIEQQLAEAKKCNAALEAELAKAVPWEEHKAEVAERGRKEG